MKTVDMYCDGSGNTLASDGGWAYRIIANDNLVCEHSGYLAKATNNIAELSAAINGLEMVKTLFKEELESTTVTLISDSQLTLGYASGAYQCKAPHLLPLYLKLRKLYKELNCQTRWVKGHSGDLHNERCDELAKNARESGRE